MGGVPASNLSDEDILTLVSDANGRKVQDSTAVNLSLPMHGAQDAHGVILNTY